MGRLDVDTTGLLLLTDDGTFLHRLTSPRYALPKVYEVTTRHALTQEQLRALRLGVVLRDDPEPVSASVCEQVSGHLLRLTITQGRYHQVRRMIAAAGNRVEALARVSVGGLRLPADLPVGAWRWLGPDELARLRPASSRE